MITRDLHAFADAFAAAAPDFGAATARAVFLVAPDGFRLVQLAWPDPAGALP